jgi:predicted permease
VNRLFICHSRHEGYVFARAGVVNSDIESGLSAYAMKVALPCLVFNTVAAVNFRTIAWQYLYTLLAAKASGSFRTSLCRSETSVIFVVVGMTFLFGKGSRIEKTKAATIYSVATTLSIDLSLGLPILQSILPAFVPYLILITIPQLVVITTGANVILDYISSREQEGGRVCAPLPTPPLHPHTFANVNPTLLTREGSKPPPRHVSTRPRYFLGPAYSLHPYFHCL